MTPDSNRLKKLESLAEKLGQAWLENSLIEEPNYSEIPQSREEAYFVQDQMSQFIGKDILALVAPTFQPEISLPINCDI